MIGAQAGVEVNIMPVVGDAGSLNFNPAEIPPSIPLLPLRNAIVFPGTVFPVTVGREKSIKLVQAVESGSGWLAAVPQMDVAVEDPTESDLAGRGTICKLIKTLEMPDGTVTAILQGASLCRVDEIVSYIPYITARVAAI